MSDRCPQCGCIQPDCGFVPNGVCTYAPASTPAPAPSRDTAGCSPEIDLSTPAKEPAAAVSESAPRISNPPKADRDTSEVREWHVKNECLVPHKINPAPHNHTTLIEKSAYDALKAKWDAVQICIADDDRRFHAQALEIEKLKASLEFAREAHHIQVEEVVKLKAERDALEQIAHVTGEETYRAKAKVWQAEIASLKAERDELRADRDELLERNERQLERLSGNRTIAEMAEAMAERDIALKERDTLRAELSETKAFLDATTGDAMCARAERDEARAECESLRECTRQDDEHIADLERERDRYKAALEYYAQIHESAWHIVSAEPAIEALEGEK